MSRPEGEREIVAEDVSVSRARRLKAYLGHVSVKFASLSLGAAYTSPFAARLRAGRDLITPPPVFNGRAAVVAHIFYPDLADEIAACLDCLPEGSDLIVTTPPEREAAVVRALERVSNVRVVPVANRGRDIAPFLHLLNAGWLDRYDAVLKIHTKKSPHLLDGDIRRRMFFTMLAGTRRNTASILRLFENASTGMVGWRRAWRVSPLYWMGNRSRVEAIFAGMKLQAPATPAFFEGTMFWVRPSAIRQLKELGLEQDRFEAEEGQLNGTLHHAVERVFAQLVADSGCHVLDRQGRTLLQQR